MGMGMACRSSAQLEADGVVHGQCHLLLELRPRCVGRQHELVEARVGFWQRALRGEGGATHRERRVEAVEWELAAARGKLQHLRLHTGTWHVGRGEQAEAWRRRNERGAAVGLGMR